MRSPARIGIIALTFLNDLLYRQAALAAGADEFVPKSRLTFDLLPAIRKVMARSGSAGHNSGDNEYHQHTGDAPSPNE
ncbi:MAG: response regulator transcription factor [Chloroflexi bacterium]|nr:response regulator transcription factor [Chloroflexota bacterium]